MYPRSVRALQADALFVSALQRSDELTASQIWRAVAVALDGYGRAGCAERVAQGFEDHPEDRSRPDAVGSCHGGDPGGSSGPEDTAGGRVQQLSLGQEPGDGTLGDQVGIIRSRVTAMAATAVVLAFNAARPGPAAPPGPQVTPVAALPGWIVREVASSTIVACDPVMCARLVQSGFPPASLIALGPGSPDPLGAQLVVATPAIRNQLGTRLASVYAPLVIASFGSGAERVDVRVVAASPSRGCSTKTGRPASSLVSIC